MLDKIKTIIEELKTSNKSVWIFACLKMDEVIDRWTLVISAPWITEANRKEELQNIIGMLKNKLTNEELSSIAGIAFLSKNDHLVEELLKKRAGDKIKDEKVNGNMVYEGEILELNQTIENSSTNSSQIQT